MIGVASGDRVDMARGFGAHEAIDGMDRHLEAAVDPVDLVFDTAGSAVLEQAAGTVQPGGRLVSVAEEPRSTAPDIEVHYFVVEPNREQLMALSRLADEGVVKPTIDSVFPLAEARAAFERSLARRKRGKVVIRVTSA